MESVGYNQKLSAIIVAAAAVERCADLGFDPDVRYNSASSSFLTACSFVVFIPAIRASFPRRRQCVRPRGLQIVVAVSWTTTVNPSAGLSAGGT